MPNYRDLTAMPGAFKKTKTKCAWIVSPKSALYKETHH